MIKEAIEKIIQLSVPNFKEYEGRLFTDKIMREVKPEPGPEPAKISINTLSGVIDYIKKDLDNESGYIIHISDYDTVLLYGKYDPEFCQRKVYVVAESKLNRFPYGRWMEVSDFIINMMSYFQNESNYTEVLSYVSSLSKDTNIMIGDDGISQTATVKTGVVNKESKTVPNPVKLIPYETFPEIKGIERSFVFRIENKRGAEAALFESGDTTWKVEYIQAIRQYFNEGLKGCNKKYSILA